MRLYGERRVLALSHKASMKNEMAPEPAAEQEAQAGPEPATPRLAPGRLASDAGPDADSPEGLDEGRFSLEPIRQSVASARVSRREYSALENPVEEP